MRRILVDREPRFKPRSGYSGERSSGKSVHSGVIGDDSVDGDATGNEIGDSISIEISVSRVFGAQSRLCEQP